MVSKALNKTFRKSYFRNKGRFLANFLTVFFSLAITAGLAAIPIDFAESFATNYVEGNAPDLIIKSKAYTGFSDIEIEEVLQLPNVESIQSFLVMDGKEDDGTYNRFYVYDFAEASIAKPTLIEGKYPQNRGEIAVEIPNKNRKEYHLGDTVSFASAEAFMGQEATIVGVLDSPLYNSVSKERAELEDQNDKQYVEAIFYLEKATLLKFMQNMKTDIYVRLSVPHDYLTESYRNGIISIQKDFLERLGEENVAILTLEETTSYGLFRNYNDKVRLISFIFPAFFIAVCALINHITITRYIKDERSIIASYLSAGLSKGRVVLKYALFAGISILIGGTIGYFLGAALLPFVVFPAYNAVFQMGAYSLIWFTPIALFVLALLFLLGVFIACFSAISYLRQEPSELVRDQAPKPGKKIWLERIPFLWKHLSFSLKSSFRNIFRQKKNFVLTSLAIIGSTLLVLIGFSLLNVSDAMKEDELFSDVASSMGLISTVIVMFAILMTVPIIYSLVSMNVADRNRELATLMVLGYQDIECSLYTFREILMIAVFAALIGLPISAVVIDLVLRYLGFGKIQDVQWWSYLSTYGIVTISVVATNFLVYPRIKRIDMNASLKSVE